MVPFTLRAGTHSDLEAMYRLDLLCFAEPFRFSRSAMARYAHSPGASTIVAEQAGQLVGFVILELVSLARRMEGYLVTLDVHPEHRRQGMASQLMAQAEQLARQHPARSLFLHVSIANYSARQLYEQLGYTATGHIPSYYAPGEDALLYRKLLNDSGTRHP